MHGAQHQGRCCASAHHTARVPSLCRDFIMSLAAIHECHPSRRHTPVPYQHAQACHIRQAPQ